MTRTHFSPARLMLSGLVAALLALLAIPLIDRPLAEAVHGSSIESAELFRSGTLALDTITGKRFFEAALPLVLLALAPIVALAKRAAAARALLFVGLSHLLSIVVSNGSKPLFGRLRPIELFEKGDWSRIWFAGGNGFPSGHVGFYAGLCLPLAYLFPRWRRPILLVPLFIGMARIDAGLHFFSDVLASASAAALIAALMTTVIERFGAMRPGAAPHGTAAGN